MDEINYDPNALQQQWPNRREMPACDYYRAIHLYLPFFVVSTAFTPSVVILGHHHSRIYCSLRNEFIFARDNISWNMLWPSSGWGHLIYRHTLHGTRNQLALIRCPVDTWWQDSGIPWICEILIIIIAIQIFVELLLLFYFILFGDVIKRIFLGHKSWCETL